jgi:ribonuclease J
MSSRIIFYGGVDEIGGNMFLLEDTLEDKVVRVLFDFGLNFSRQGELFSFPEGVRKYNALSMFFELGVYSIMQQARGVYRQDYLRRMGLEPTKEPTLDALVLSHPHIDHAAGIHLLRPDIPIYMSQGAKKVLWNLETTSSTPFNEFLLFKYLGGHALHTKQDRFTFISGDSVAMPRDIRVFNEATSEKKGESFNVGHVKVESYGVDHSVPGSCGFIIHTSSGPVVFTGDLRLRGRKGKETKYFIQKAKEAKPKYMLCEGTGLSKTDSGTEEDIVKNLTQIVKKTTGLVVVDYAGRNMDRIVSMAEVAKKTGRIQVIDSRQANLLEQFRNDGMYPKLGSTNLRVFLPRKGSGSKGLDVPPDFVTRDYFKWERRFLTMNKRARTADGGGTEPLDVSIKELQEHPEKFILFLNRASFYSFIEIKPPKGSLYIRSNVNPFNEEMKMGEKKLLNWLKLFNLLKQRDLLSMMDSSAAVIPSVHISGHVNETELEWLTNYIAPENLIPIHTDAAYTQRFRDVFDGNVIFVGRDQALDLDTGKARKVQTGLRIDLERKVTDKTRKKFKKLHGVKKDSIIIDARKVGSYLFCNYSYYLDSLIRDGGMLPMSGLVARSLWLKDIFRNLIPRENGKLKLFVGENLDYIGDLKGEELAEHLKFKSAESFANNAMSFQWLNTFIKFGRKYDREIYWAPPVYSLKGLSKPLRKICQNYYNFLLDTGLPILNWSGRKVAFFHEDERYVVNFNWLRNGMQVGADKIASKKLKQSELDQDWLVTLKLLAYCTIGHEVRADRMKWGIEDEIARKWGGHEMYIDPQIQYVVHDLPNERLYSTTRTDEDIPAMLKVIHEAKEGIDAMSFEPNFDNCLKCSYNIQGYDGEPICKKRNPDVAMFRPREDKK